MAPTNDLRIQGCDVCGIVPLADAPSYEQWLDEFRPRRGYADDDDGVLRLYNRDGQPIGRGMWAWFLETQWGYKIVKHTHYGRTDRPMVSTVWLGMDHGFYGGPPLIFETMVFGFGGKWEGFQERYHTEAQALEGHDKIVSEIGAKGRRG